MRPLMSRGALTLLAVGGLGCASSSSKPDTAPSVAVQAGAGQMGPALLQWTGKFRNTQQASQAVTPLGTNIASGSIVLTAPNERETHVQLNLSGPSDQNEQLRWVIAPGACRSGTIPLLPVNSFPLIHVSEGHGDLDTNIGVPLPTSGTLHVNIFDANGSGSDETDVLTCAELKLDRRH